MITVDKETSKFEFYKENEDDKIWWVDYFDQTGLHAVSFDKEYPYWANFFRKRK